MINFVKIVFFLIFLVKNPSHFAICYTSIDVSSSGVHNLIIDSDSLVQIKIPEYYQAFIFSNCDMGKYNFFSVDGGELNVKYRNLYAISFNESSTITIRTNYTSKQNLAVFIIPHQICEQHSFYAMSKNAFDIKIVSKRSNYDLKICGFSPSFVTNVNRKVSIGYQNEINAQVRIFYGFQTINSTEFSNSQSIGSGITTFDDINTTYYVSYNVSETNVEVKLTFTRDFEVKNDNKAPDNSMLPSHFDCLVYYDKSTSGFIYDDRWIKTFSVNYRANQWEMMKWAWRAIYIMIAIFLVIIFIVLGFFLYKKIRMKRRNLDEESEGEFDQVDERSQQENNLFTQSIIYSPYIDVSDDEQNNYLNRKNENNFDDSSVENDKINQLDNNYYIRKKINKKGSPYNIDDENDDIYSYADDEKSDDEIPNPYGLPTLKINNNDNENEDSDLY